MDRLIRALLWIPKYVLSLFFPKNDNQLKDTRANQNSFSNIDHGRVVNDKIATCHPGTPVNCTFTINKRILSERQEKFREVFRLLRFDEVMSGLKAKSPSSSTDIVVHVAFGSRGNASRYISTCSSLYAAKNLLSVKQMRGCSYGNERIVRIDVTKLPHSVLFIDLTSYGERQKHIRSAHSSDTIYRYHKFAENFGEVLLVGFVPSDCLSLVEL